MRKKKVGILLMCAIIGLICLGSCSKKEAPAEEKEVILSWLNMPVGLEADFTAWKDKLIAQFEADNPGIKIEQDLASWNDGPNKLMAAILAGDGPDLAHMGSWTTAQVYASGGALDLTNIYSQFGGYDGTYVAGGRDLCEYDGKLYGVPWGGNSRAVLIREDRLQKAGIPIPSMEWTWEEFLDVAQKLKGVDGVEFPVGIFGNADDLFFLWNAWTVARNGGRDNGIGVYSKDMTTATANSPAGLQALKDLCDLVGLYKVASPSIIEWDGTVIESKFLDGSLSMILGSPDYGFTTNAVNTGMTEKAIVLPPPTYNGGFGATLHLSVTCVMSYTENPDEALKFLAYLNTSENQAEFNKVAGWIPARMDSWDLDRERINYRMDGTLYGMENGICIMPGNPQAINIKNLIQRSCNGVLALIAQGQPYNDQVIKAALDAANLDVQAELDRAIAGR